MSNDMILSYELKDDPGNEREVYVDSLEHAHHHLEFQAMPGMIDWACLTTSEGILIATTEDLV